MLNQQRKEQSTKSIGVTPIFRYLITLLCYISYMALSLQADVSENKTLVYEEFSKNIDKKDIAELYALVKDRVGDQKNYIQLSETDFIVNVANVGLYLADLATFTMDERPFAQGIVTLEYSLNDKSGKSYLIFHHHYPMRRGYSGNSYSLVTTKASTNGKINISLEELGSSDEYSEEVPQFCDVKGNSDKHINTKVQATIEDLNKDNYPDIKVVTTQLNCKTRKTEIVISEYLATKDGFINVRANEDANKVTKKLLEAQKKALSNYTLSKNINFQNYKIFEDAGIQNYIYVQPTEMSLKTYVGLLNDYAFFLGPFSYEKSIEILNRVIQLDPTRGVAYLNRAEIFFLTLSNSDVRITQKDKEDTVKNITDDYAKYKELTGKTIDKWEKFVAFNLNEYPKNMNVCEYIFRYETEEIIKQFSKRIEEIFLRTHRIDINNDGHLELVYFDEPKYGGKSYGGIRFQDSKGDWKKFDEDVTYKKPSGYGFHIFSFEGKIYKLMPDYDVTLIEGDKEVLVCEAKRERMENAQGIGEYFINQLKSMKKVY
jgi:hypothetical protein